MLIQNIPGLGLSNITATPELILSGKTIYNGDGNLITGILSNYNDSFQVSNITQNSDTDDYTFISASTNLTPLTPKECFQQVSDIHTELYGGVYSGYYRVPLEFTQSTTEYSLTINFTTSTPGVIVKDAANNRGSTTGIMLIAALSVSNGKATIIWEDFRNDSDRITSNPISLPMTLTATVYYDSDEGYYNRRLTLVGNNGDTQTLEKISYLAGFDKFSDLTAEMMFGSSYSGTNLSVQTGDMHYYNIKFTCANGINMNLLPCRSLYVDELGLFDINSYKYIGINVGMQSGADVTTTW